MIQHWQKEGLIYAGRAQIPTVFEKDKDTWRIFFADRTKDNKSFIRYIDVEAGNPKNIKYEFKDSLLDFGSFGAFDHEGIMPSWVVKESGNVYLYYIGWSVRKDVPYQNSIGLAMSRDNGDTFEKVTKGPMLGTDPQEPYFCSTPCVISRLNADHLYYLSCVGWWQTDPAAPLEARYLIKHRERGVTSHWGKFSDTIIDFKNNEEGGICRPSIIVENNNWHMWYCYRDLWDYRNNKQHSYKIGYAMPNFDIRDRWIRKDEDCLLELSSQGWDSEMLCYPYVIKFKDLYYMFYNGNGFGTSGFGYATLESRVINNLR